MYCGKNFAIYVFNFSVSIFSLETIYVHIAFSFFISLYIVYASLILSYKETTVVISLNSTLKPLIFI